MPSNQAIADIFYETASLLTLKQENSFKIKAYETAGESIENFPEALEQFVSTAKPPVISGVGAGMWQNVKEIVTTGSFQVLSELKNEIPPGVVEIAKVRGLGPKKVIYLWQDVGIVDLDELAEACKTGSLAKFKGFGVKTLQNILQEIEALRRNKNKLRLDRAALFAEELLALFKRLRPQILSDFTGALRRDSPTIEKIAVVVGVPDESAFLEDLLKEIGGKSSLAENNSEYKIYEITDASFPDFEIVVTPSERFVYARFCTSVEGEHLELLRPHLKIDLADETTLYAEAGWAYVPPEARENMGEIEIAKSGIFPTLISFSDVKGVLHAHSTYSDGKNTLREMALACQELGYDYLGITDHSRTAVYAGGLSIERVQAQRAEIEILNGEFAPFRIFHGIESDILIDGSLDYPPETLADFDFIIASIHSGFNMDKKTATERLIAAVRNPFTTILGHPTGRLLLSRDGYPIDHEAVIDACAEAGTAIEINANPWRLDLDWIWIPYALARGVKIAICPDAHTIGGIRDVRFGVRVARKGRLTPQATLNALSVDEIASFFNQRKGNNPLISR